jgi:hypothetical protein
MNSYFVDTERFINQSKKVHGDMYDYSLVNYVAYNQKVDIICKKHGVFQQKPTDHKDKGRGCQKCGMEKAQFNKFNTKMFIDKCKIIFNDKYDYSLVKYISGRNPVTIICPSHGEFRQMASNHLRGKGCLICKESKGELKISKLLSGYSIKFERQYKFDGCVNKNRLPFDFYLPLYNACIEYDGEMHFNRIERFGGLSKIEYYKINDNIKTKFCTDNNIMLFRIKFDQNIDNEVRKIYTKLCT